MGFATILATSGSKSIPKLQKKSKKSKILILHHKKVYWVVLHKKLVPNSQIKWEATIPKVFLLISMMLHVDCHIWDSFQIDSLVKGLWIPRLPLDFRFCHQLWTAITFSKIICLQKFWVFWKATDLNRPFHPKTSSRDKIKVSLGTHAFGEFRKNHDLRPAPPQPSPIGDPIWDPFFADLGSSISVSPRSRLRHSNSGDVHVWRCRCIVSLKARVESTDGGFGLEMIYTGEARQTNKI